MALNGLRHKRSRLQGDIALLKRRNAQYEKECALMKKALKVNAAKIAKYQQQIDELGETAELVFNISLEVPVARMTFPKSKKYPWGYRTRFLLEAIRLAKGTPLSPSDLTEIFIRSHELMLSDKEYLDLHLRVRKTLQRLGLANILVRVSRLPGFTGEMTWRLPDSAD